MYNMSDDLENDNKSLQVYNDMYMNQLQKKKFPTICFATMCKNEEHCIRKTLESVAPFIDTWVVCDTGSTDKTCEIVEEFFREKGIVGELFHDEWKRFDYNKSLLFERCQNRADYIMHFDADDYITGAEFDKSCLESRKDLYLMLFKRGTFDYKAHTIFNGAFRWKLYGVAHNVIKPIGVTRAITEGSIETPGLYVCCEGVGSRAFDPKKYLYDAVKLEKQMNDCLIEDPDNLYTRSIFYTAQSYMDYGDFVKAAQYYKMYIHTKDTWNEELFESYLRYAQCLMTIKDKQLDKEMGIEITYERIMDEMQKAMDLFGDRAEPYFILGKYLNQNSQCELSYKYLKKATEMDFEKAKSKYILFVRRDCYGAPIYDELAVSCYWTERVEEGIQALLGHVFKDKEYYEANKERLDQNKIFFGKKLIG